MMGREAPLQRKLFYTNFNLERHIRGNHPLRHIAQRIDFECAYQEVAGTDGENGHVSVPPPMVLKLMLLLVLYNVRSERELMATLPERLDWLRRTTPLSLPHPERMNAALDVVSVYGTEVARIEGTAIRVGHQQEFRGGQHILGHTESWQRPSHQIFFKGLTG